MTSKPLWFPPVSWPTGFRNEKPRTQGVTMIFDKGIGLVSFHDLLEMAADHIDFIKLGFGSAALYRPEILEQKVNLARRYGVEVYVGGTLGEIAYWQGGYEELLAGLQAVDIRWVEISDGTIQIPSRERRALIRKVTDRGFQVLTEVGKKDPRQTLPLPAIIRQIREDLAEGASYVIVEGRESGKGVNFYDSKGEIRDDDLEAMVEAVGKVDALLWEAPMKEQQQALIKRFGVNVNLGNIPVHEAIALESLRRGLRSDTLALAIEEKARQEASAADNGRP
ncbi:phosphosulfolactate synthase [Heliobacterium gestii]|uniref:Phosphosulfolactate synthase n=1 Tax=Heliomicrobium gestii TaxID=2699 RepID=A0A845LMP9_HELGE|nr:phosphosulfolactate synthase [Heliomicrobium gestii]MBM7867773.1 phosphosulfolactate synthase [Heliomicrobium gestii]MZP44166.1 phosphosulfolactate synthase [Heliomicrobium gestii]